MTKADGTPVTVYVDANYNFVCVRRGGCPATADGKKGAACAAPLALTSQATC